MTATTTSTSNAAGRRRRFSDARWAGAGGLAFLVLVVVQNLVKAANDVANNASAAEILAFAHRDEWTVHLLFATYVLGFPALFVFAAGVGGLAERRDPAAALPARIGRLSVAVIAVLFGLINVAQVTLVAARSDLVGDPALVRTLWAGHNALFTLNLVAVGGALFGLGTAAAVAGLVPRWFRHLSWAGALALALSAMPIVAQVQGSPLLALGLAGFVCWLVFLAVAGVRLVTVEARQDG